MMPRGGHNKTHGMTLSPEYNSWCSIKTRCYNKDSKDYPRYGGRGITVCKAWRDSFEAFFKDMGIKPVFHEIERIDNEDGYHPENCKWATKKDQARNRRSSFMITVDNITQCAAAWSEDTGIPESTLRYRIRNGWNPTDAVCKTPQ